MNLFFLFFLPLLVTLLITPLFIKWIRKKQFGQSIRKEGPETHQKKTGTPTMGGAVILLVIMIFSLCLIDLEKETLLLIFLMVGTGSVGFLDDFIKVIMKRNLGLTSIQKLVLQLSAAGIFMYLMSSSGRVDTTISIPGITDAVELSWFYYVFAVFLILGTTNATNLTDGLDGLLSGTAIFSIGAFVIISFLIGISGVGELGLIAIGSIIGFLWFNKYPAKIFMGDTGSLAIGGLLAGMAILLKAEVLLVLIGGIYVVETLSVIIQVSWFKLTKKRVFRMSPIHHHYELEGFSETKVVAGFWFAGFIFSATGALIFLL